jgi:pyruvate dehydrogenase E1 component
VAANVLNLTSPQLLYQQWRTLKRWSLGSIGGEKPSKHLETLIPPDERKAPIVTVQDGASHALAWLGSVYGSRVISLGVDDFGQSGTRAELYRHYEVDAEHIASAAYATLDG